MPIQSSYLLINKYVIFELLARFGMDYNWTFFITFFLLLKLMKLHLIISIVWLNNQRKYSSLKDKKSMIKLLKLINN
jgi:hypothetical protein